MDEKPFGDILIVDNDDRSLILAKRLLKSVSHGLLYANSAEETLDTLDKLCQLPDVVVIDICLKQGEQDRVSRERMNISEVANLADISGVRLLADLRYRYPNLPIILWSGFRTDEIEELQQHAIGVAKKGIPDQIRCLLWMSQRAVIGVRFPEGIHTDVKVKVEQILSKINHRQRYYWFVLHSKSYDPFTPPDEVPGLDALGALRAVKAWNKRVFALVDEDPTYEDIPCPILPFGERSLVRYTINVSIQAEYLSWKLFPALLTRELARVAYRVFCRLGDHKPATRECLLDDSAYAPYLLDGIQAEALCPKCQAIMRSTIKKKYDGLNDLKRVAAEVIHQIARESLDWLARHQDS